MESSNPSSNKFGFTIDQTKEHTVLKVSVSELTDNMIRPTFCNLVILLDISGSMNNVTSDGNTRYKNIVKIVIEELKVLVSHYQMLYKVQIVGFNNKPIEIIKFVLDQSMISTVEDALNKITPSNGTNYEHAFNHAIHVCKDLECPVVIMASDGEDCDESTRKKIVSYLKKSNINPYFLGISGCKIQDMWQLGVVVEVASDTVSEI
jgi:Mg-chelatase subunit ChlD